MIIAVMNEELINFVMNVFKPVNFEEMYRFKNGTTEKRCRDYFYACKDKIEQILICKSVFPQHKVITMNTQVFNNLVI